MASVLAESAPLPKPSFSFIKPSPVDAHADHRSIVKKKNAGESASGPKSEKLMNKRVFLFDAECNGSHGAIHLYRRNSCCNRDFILLVGKGKAGIEP